MSDEYENQDSSSSSSIATISTWPYNWNRFLLFILDCSLMILASSLVFHQFIAQNIIPIPSWNDTVVPRVRAFRNDSGTFSKQYTTDVMVQNAQRQHDINTTLDAEYVRVHDLIVTNDDIIENITLQEAELRGQYHVLTNFLLESSADGVEIEMIGVKSFELKQAIQARLKHDEEYLHNKTIGLLPTVLPILPNNLITVAELQLHVTNVVNPVRDQVLTTLSDLRTEFATVYALMLAQIDGLEGGLDFISDQYTPVLRTLRKLYELIETINAYVDAVTLGLIDIPFLRNARIDITDFSFPDYYIPGFIDFPDVDTVLQTLDDFILRIEKEFVLLVDEIVDRTFSALEGKVDDAISILMDAFTLDDYHPPSIRFEQRSLSPTEALALDSQLIADLTNHITASTANRPIPSLLPEERTIVIPQVPFNSESFEFTRPPADFFVVRYPVVEEFLWKILEWITLALSGWAVIADVVINGYRSLSKLWQYILGTACPAPIVDLVSNAEKNEGQEQRQKSRGYKIAKMFKVLVEYGIFSIVIRTPVATLTVAIVASIGTYYTTQFQPGCIDSTDGTWLVQNIVAPIQFNHVLAQGNAHAKTVNLQNHFLIQQECSRGDAYASQRYQEQSLEFEQRQAQISLVSHQLQHVTDHVDMVQLCQAHTLACQEESGLLAGDKCSTTLAQNGVVMAHPCNFNFSDANGELFAMDHDTTVLEVIDFDCSSVPSEPLSFQYMGGYVQDELKLEEVMCLVEWFVIGRLMQLFYIFISIAVLNQARNVSVRAIQDTFWKHLRPEVYHLNILHDRDGFAIHPEHDDFQVRADAMLECSRSLQRGGILRLILGFTMLFGWIGGTYYLYHVNMVPPWAAGFAGTA